MKKRVLILFSIIPFIVGFSVAYFQGKPKNQTAVFDTSNIQPTDTIILSNNGNIYKLNQNRASQITHNQNLIEPIALGNAIAAIKKTTNYSSLLLFDQSGNKIKTLFNGNSNNIDTMSWITDPAVNSTQDRIAYVSDKDKVFTNVPDNALYVLNLSTGKSTNIAKPDPYSGGIAHPIFDPSDKNIILYDYYQYDPKTLMPYSAIKQFDNASGLITTLTYENRNAYQASFSPDGKKILFLERNGDSNNVALCIADFNNNSGLSNIKTLAIGDFAYPEFSNTKWHIYFLQAQGNKGYNLLTGTVYKNGLNNIRTIVSGNTLLGNSSYSVIRNTAR